MSNNASLSTLLNQYQTLCRYCDEFFAKVLAAYRAHILCAKGCAGCCTLETVVPLEAYVIASYLRTLPPSQVLHTNQSHDQCVLLNKNLCTIYPVRPIICRTHGLAFIYPDKQDIDVCPLNFTEFDVTSIDPKYLLDVESVTANLIRLNLAFWIITGNKEAAGDRIPLHSIMTGEYQTYDY